MSGYHYGRPEMANSYSNVLSVLSAHDSLHSVRTSSLPLTQFWGPIGLTARLAKIPFLKSAGVKDCDMFFEFPTSVLNGRGKASMTDLMIITHTHRIAVEAKYTEYLRGEYEAISKWNKENEKNKWDVVEGWLKYMGLSRESVSKIGRVPYQLLHRIASAYAGRGDLKAAVIYQLFYDEKTEKHLDKFVRMLKDGLALLSPKELHFLVVRTLVERIPDELGKENGDYYLLMGEGKANREVYGSLEKSEVLFEVDL